MQYYIGLMSGTSLDGVDAVLCTFKAPHSNAPFSVLGHLHLAYPSELRAELDALAKGCSNEIDVAGHASRKLGEFYATAVNTLLEAEQIAASQVVAIGNHGQTVRHRIHGDYPFTLQIGCHHTLACQTGIAVIADFRSKDVALGGQGAPLVPAFHHFAFTQQLDADAVVFNIGGIANLTYLPQATQGIIGFDSGPGNTLMDYLAQKHFAQPYDAQGNIAADGHIIAPLLADLLTEPYLAATWPKSTGRELFSPTWLEQRLACFQQAHSVTMAPADLLATLTEYTAKTMADAIAMLPSIPAAVLLCGGGAYNPFLVKRIKYNLADVLSLDVTNLSITISQTEAFGLAADQVEATAFAYLAYCYEQGIHSNVPSVTGAKHATVLGVKYFP